MDNERWIYILHSILDIEKEIKTRKFYDKKEAMELFESLPEEQKQEVKKHTEIIEVIA